MENFPAENVLEIFLNSSEKIWNFLKIFRAHDIINVIVIAIIIIVIIINLSSSSSSSSGLCWHKLTYLIARDACRVHPETTINELRSELDSQISCNLLPSEFVFLRCVGRCFTVVRCLSPSILRSQITNEIFGLFTTPNKPTVVTARACRPVALRAY